MPVKGAGEASSEDGDSDSGPPSDVDWSFRQITRVPKDSTPDLAAAAASNAPSAVGATTAASGAVHSPGAAAAEHSRNEDSKMQFVGRKLDVHIIRADHLPKMDFAGRPLLIATKHLRCFGFHSRCPRHQPVNCLPGAADPYVKMTVGEHRRVSKTVKNSLNPEWDEHFEFELDTACNELLFTV